MPYNPGIQDISGQLLAQGMQARAQGIAGGVTTLFQGLQQNQMMTNQAIARFQAATAANPKLLDFLNKAGTEESPVPVNPDVLKAYADIKSGKTNVQNTALLAQFADSYNQAEMAQQQQLLRQAQTDLIAAQAEKAQRENALMQQDEEFFANLERMAKAGEKAPEQPSAIATPQQAEALARFATQLPKAGGAPSVGGVPAMLARGAQPAAAPLGEVGGIPTTATRQRPYAGPTEQDILEARMQLGPGATRNSIRLQANKIAESRAKAIVPSGVFQTEEEAMREASRLDESLPVSGYTRAAKYDPTAKGYVLTQLPSVQTVEEKAREATLVEAGKTRAAGAEKYISDLSTAAAEASDDRYRLQQIRNLYEEGVSTGFTSGDWFVRAQSLGAELGLIDPKKQAKKEELIALLAQDSLTKTRTLLKGQGSVANAERERVDKISTDAKKRPEANLELVKTTDGVYKKLIAAENERMRLEDQGLNSVEVQKRVQRWWLSNKLDKFMDGGAALPSGWEEIR